LALPTVPLKNRNQKEENSPQIPKKAGDLLWEMAGEEKIISIGRTGLTTACGLTKAPHK
jgi:hypothetical protein